MNTHSVYHFQKYGALSFSYYQLPTLSVSLQFPLSVAKFKPDSEQFSSYCFRPNSNFVENLKVLRYMQEKLDHASSIKVHLAVTFAG